MQNETIKRLFAQMNSIIIGKEEQVTLLVAALLAKGHVLLEDVPGVGKTTLANTLARSVDLSFGRIQFTPDTLPSDITGISIYNKKTDRFEYQKGVILHNIVLADEINRTSPKTQASLLEAMEEGQVTVDGMVHKMDQPFMVLATQNPTRFLGTYNLPEAQLDRFLMRISLGYPKKEEEVRMAQIFLGDNPLTSCEAVMSKEELLGLQQLTEQVYIHEDLIAYAVSLIERTRQNEYVTLGASPRAVIALLRTSRAMAFLHGRKYVIPDDIKEVWIPVVAHRLVLSVDARMNHKTAEDVLTQIMISVKVPVLLEEASE